MGVTFLQFRAVTDNTLIRVFVLTPSVFVLDGEDKVVAFPLVATTPSVFVLDGEDKVVAFPLVATTPSVKVFDGEDKVAAFPFTVFNS